MYWNARVMPNGWDWVVSVNLVNINFSLVKVTWILCGFCFYFAASINGICHFSWLWLDAVKCRHWLMHSALTLVLKFWLYIGHSFSCVCFIHCWKSGSMITNFLSFLVTLAELSIKNYVWNVYESLPRKIDCWNNKLTMIRCKRHGWL